MDLVIIEIITFLEIKKMDSSIKCIKCNFAIAVDMDEFVKNSKDDYIHFNCLLILLENLSFISKMGNPSMFRVWLFEYVTLWDLIKIGLREYGLEFIQFIIKKLQEKNKLDKELDKVLIKFSEFTY